MTGQAIPALFPEAPLRERILPFGSRTISLLTLKEPLALIAKQADQPDHEVYWGELWPASLALTDALLSGDVWLPSGAAPILELGCGVGLTAVAVALAGGGQARVLATDLEPRALRLTTANAQRNGVAHLVETQVLDWRAPYAARHRLILAADCLYRPDSCREVLAFVRQALDRAAPPGESRAVIVDPDRWSARDFAYLAQEAGFRVRSRRRNVPFTAGQGAAQILPQTGPASDAEAHTGQPIEAVFYELTRA